MKSVGICNLVDKSFPLTNYALSLHTNINIMHMYITFTHSFTNSTFTNIYLGIRK